MSNEELRGQPGEFSIREETVNSTVEAWVKSPSAYSSETITLMTKNDPELGIILRSKLVLGKQNISDRVQTGTSQQIAIVTGGLMAWRVFYNEDPSIPPIPINTSEESKVSETDLESIKMTDPHFYNFVRKIEAESGMPRLFRLGAMIVYSLKHPSLHA